MSIEKELVSSAIKELEKEKQEAEIRKIKDIVKAYLEKISSKKESLKSVQDELKELENDLNDLKMGRLDKIEERQEKDPKHNEITLIIIKRVEKEFIPYQPWRSSYIIEPRYPIWQTQYTATGGSNLINCSTTCSQNAYLTQATAPSMTATGIMFQNFCGGTYAIGGQTISFN
jgi:DNA gyrase/topoisomerase IV subunit A